MTIAEALRRTLALVEASQTSAYAPQTAEDIAHELGAALAALASGERVDRFRLKVLFAPTGVIQETAIDNGWGEEFLWLSERLDASLEDSQGEPT
jgi:hypothetical protein